jgi:hypothetical protein
MTAIHRTETKIVVTPAIALQELRGADKITCIASTCFKHMLAVLCTVGNLKQPLPYHPSTKSSSISHSQLYVKKTSHAGSITNKVSNSSAKRRAPHQIDPPVPPSPLHHFLAPSDIDPDRSPFEGLLMANKRRRTRKKRTKQSRRKSFITRHPAMTAD